MAAGRVFYDPRSGAIGDTISCGNRASEWCSSWRPTTVRQCSFSTALPSETASKEIEKFGVYMLRGVREWRDECRLSPSISSSGSRSTCAQEAVGARCSVRHRPKQSSPMAASICCAAASSGSRPWGAADVRNGSVSSKSPPGMFLLRSPLSSSCWQAPMRLHFPGRGSPPGSGQPAFRRVASGSGPQGQRAHA
jgi:hypothetical protein